MFLTGCGTDFDFQTKYGFKVIKNDYQINAHHIDSTFKETAMRVASTRERKYSFENIKNKVEIYEPYIEFVPQLYCFPSECNGHSSANYLKIVHKDCMLDTALVHELLHMIEIQISDRYDYDHSDQQYWLLESEIKDKMLATQNFCQ